ncbi:MAG: alpha amylase N-terminal ig-like domain-containing protein [Armatimonadetes bacterium]|nr:alpha amylase N-terminal ig-like domain-containing protein [Armatimonadota bacterium]
MLTALALATLGLADGRMITFRFVPKSEAKRISVVGQFNQWDQSRHPMALTKDGKTWSAEIQIQPGVYQYLFCVDGRQWIPDPSAPTVVDPNGNTNSQLLVTPLAYDEQPGVLGDGLITKSAVQHHPPADTFRSEGNSFCFRLRTRANDVERVFLVVNPAQGKARRVVARNVDRGPIFDTWSFFTPISGKISYSFQLIDGETESVYPEGRLIDQDFSKWPKPKVPQWLEGRVFYQIFPDRFANGSKENDPPNAPEWGASTQNRTFFGGDVQGVLKHLDHIIELGANALYFNPIFKTESYHGYDISDYEHLDPRFGTNEAFRDLVKQAHAADMKVILDGVFNHSSIEFFAFKDLRERGEASPYRDWYTIYKFPIEILDGQKSYLSWAGVKAMPKLNQENPATREYFTKVSAEWISKYGIDGWRLDVANEVSQDFWRQWRPAMRKADPEAYIVGEIWDDAHEWMQGDMFDSLMNYQWRQAVLSYFNSRLLSTRTFIRDLNRVRSIYPAETFNAMFNMLGSHDTPRIRTIFGDKMDRVKLALAFQMAYPGVPSIYYGDEVGMPGSYDPDCRRCMDWTKKSWDMDHLNLHKQLIKLRTSVPSLMEGDCSLSQQGSVLQLVRKSGKSEFLGLWNNTEKAAQVKVGPGYRLVAGRSVESGSMAPTSFAWYLK